MSKLSIEQNRMTFADKDTHSGESPTARSPYENMKAFLDFILQNMGEEIKRRKLDIDGQQVAERLNIDIAEMEEMLELFARFYIFFRQFFKGDPLEDPTKNTAKKTVKNTAELDEKSASSSIPPAKNEQTNQIVLDEKTAGYLSDFCLLFKNKDFTPTDLNQKFPALFDLWQQIPILFNVKVSTTAEDFSDKLRKHKAMGKKPKQLSVGELNFKIEYK